MKEIHSRKLFRLQLNSFIVTLDKNKLCPWREKKKISEILEEILSVVNKNMINF
jgi:preprotein translocase subunit SecA